MIRIICGDALAELAKLPAASVHCCVTSPPYWGLRDYGVAGQIGLESTPSEYVVNMVAVFREVRRVLRDDGTLWLNLGDSYSNDTKWGGSSGGKNQHSADGGYQGQRVRRNGDCDPKRGPAAPGQPYQQFPSGLKPKDLCEIPSDVVRALRADGWWLRSRIPWIKRNAMPESTKDRPTTAVEYVFLLSKSERYYYDGEAVKIACASGPSDIKKMRESLPRIGGKHKDLDDPLSKASAATNIGQKRSVGNPEGRARRNSDWFFESWQGMLQDEVGDPLALIVNPQPFKEAHFATFPPSLIEPCIMAGCPVGGTVLDPFGGAGTTGLVADRFQRSAVLIELNPEYADMARARVTADGPLFADVA